MPPGTELPARGFCPLPLSPGAHQPQGVFPTAWDCGGGFSAEPTSSCSCATGGGRDASSSRGHLFIGVLPHPLHSRAPRLSHHPGKFYSYCLHSSCFFMLTFDSCCGCIPLIEVMAFKGRSRRPQRPKTAQMGFCLAFPAALSPPCMAVMRSACGRHPETDATVQGGR